MRSSTISIGLSMVLLSGVAGKAQRQREAQPASGIVKNTENTKPRPDQVEDIYVAHSIRVSTVSPPTAFCNNAPFKDGTITEAYYTWSSVETRAADGRLSNSAVKTIGNIRAGRRPPPAPGGLANRSAQTAPFAAPRGRSRIGAYITDVGRVVEHYARTTGPAFEVSEDQHLLLEEHGFGNHRAGAARTGKSGDCRQ
jgi:hypothetical protein